MDAGSIPAASTNFIFCYNEIMYKLNSILFVIISINIIANDNYENFECYSTNPELGDSAHWAATSIDLFDKSKYKEAVSVVDACFSKFSYDAVVMLKEYNDKNTKFPHSGRVSRKEREKIHENWAVNDVSVALWSKARSLEEMGDIELAKISYSQCIFLTHGRAWDPKGWFWVPASDCADRGQKLIQ